MKAWWGKVNVGDLVEFEGKPFTVLGKGKFNSAHLVISGETYWRNTRKLDAHNCFCKPIKKEALR